MIRDAKLDDLEEIILLGYEMHQESRYRDMDYSVERVAASMASMICSEHYLVLVQEQQNKIVGGFVAVASEPWFSCEKTASDLSLYVAPEHRGGMAAIKMVKRYVEWAKKRGVKPENIQLGVSTGVHLDATARLYDLLGFKKTGAIFHYMGGQ